METDLGEDDYGDEKDLWGEEAWTRYSDTSEDGANARVSGASTNRSNALWEWLKNDIGWDKEDSDDYNWFIDDCWCPWNRLAFRPRIGYWWTCVAEEIYQGEIVAMKIALVVGTLIIIVIGLAGLAELQILGLLRGAP
jgi:hypothetical protein